MSPPSTISDVPGLSTKPQACVPAGVWTCPSERGAAPLGHTHGEMAGHLRAPWPQATRGPRGPRRARHWALPQRHLRHALTGVCCAHIPVRRHQPPPPVVRGHTLGCTGRSGPHPRPLPEAPRRAGPEAPCAEGPPSEQGHAPVRRRWPLRAAAPVLSGFSQWGSALPPGGLVALCSGLAGDRCLSARGRSQSGARPATDTRLPEGPPTTCAASSPQARFLLLDLAAPQNSDMGGGGGRGDSRIENQIRAASTSDSLSMAHTCRRPPN